MRVVKLELICRKIGKRRLEIGRRLLKILKKWDIAANNLASVNQHGLFGQAL